MKRSPIAVIALVGALLVASSAIVGCSKGGSTSGQKKGPITVGSGRHAAFGDAPGESVYSTHEPPAAFRPKKPIIQPLPEAKPLKNAGPPADWSEKAKETYRARIQRGIP